MRWHGAWIGAQVTGVIVSSLIWLLIAAGSPPATGVALVAGVVLVAGRNTRVGLWWRFGARPATSFERGRVLEAIVPVASLRGRGQPAVWIATRHSTRLVVMPSSHNLVISREMLSRVVLRQINDDRVCVLVSQAAGQQPIESSTLVAAVSAYCLPSTAIEIVVASLGRASRSTRLMSMSWKARWLILAVALVDSAQAARWPVLFGLAAFAALSVTTPLLRKRWNYTLRRLGDERVVADGFGPDLAAMIRRTRSSVADEERAEALDHEASRASSSPRGALFGRSSR
jgi:hypothetical protein